MNLPRVILAGTHSGVGKTTLTLGIILALRKKCINVQAFKAGPDYIDPSYHTEASGNACGNLDSWLLSKDAVLELFKRRADNADVSIIEGVMGLYDGLKDSEQGSTSHLAKILKCPVILILNAHSLSRSAAAIALGYKEFDRGINIAGIILNNIGSKSHYHYVKTAIERKTKIPVLGYLPRDSNLKLSERHLGLIPLKEKKLQHGFYQKISKLIKNNINLSGIIKISRQAGPLPHNKERIFTPLETTAQLKNRKMSLTGFKKEYTKGHVTIAVAKDEAFNFYYRDNLDILMHLGAEILTFSPLRDRELPKGIDGLYIGGGFPELFASGLSKNKRLKGLIYQKAEEGLPIYAECGGLMYLMDAIVDFSAAGGSLPVREAGASCAEGASALGRGGKKKKFPMVGIFKGLVKMADRRQALGYVNVETTRDNILSKKGARIRGHVFHWSYLEASPKEYPYVYKITKDKDKVFSDGIIKKKVLASYVHLHFASCLDLPKNFIHSCKEYRMNHAKKTK